MVPFEKRVLVLMVKADHGGGIRGILVMQTFGNSVSTPEVVPVQCELEFIFIIYICDRKCSKIVSIDVVHQHY